MTINKNKQNTKTIIFLRCCYGYCISGMVILSFGAIMPSLIAESGMNFAAAGGLISFMAIGNFLASFVFPTMTAKIGLRPAITFWSFAVPVSLFFFSALPSLAVMYLLVFCIGIARGSITIINNQAVNQLIPNPARHLNLLHCSFAVGAFTSPFLTAWLIAVGLNWRAILYLLIALSLTSACSYCFLDYSILMPLKTKSSNSAATKDTVSETKMKKSAAIKTTAKEGSEISPKTFLCCLDFYLVAFVLFFYLGIENCINGWFVTYLQSTGTMSEQFAANMVSVTWITIMVGRLITAKISASVKRSSLILIQTCGSAACFFLLIFASNLTMITAALIGLGLFLAGIYPTCIAEGGQFIVGSTWGMSILTAISAAGGIITPQLVGWLADSIGMSAAFGALIVNVILMIILGASNFLRARMR